MEWFKLLGTALQIAEDLHVDTNNDPQSFIGKLNTWSYTPEGQRALGHINQLLEELGMSLRLAGAHKP